MVTKLVTHADTMSRDRFKQEAALVVLDRLMEAVSNKIVKRFHGTEEASLSKSLLAFEESRASVIATLAESISDSVAGVMGPDGVPHD